MMLRPARLPLLLCALLLWGAPRARATALPDPVELPQTLLLPEALRLLRGRGLDLLIADAATRSAEGAVKIAGAVPNPVIGGSAGYAVAYSTTRSAQQDCLQNSSVCAPWVNNINIGDSAALEDTLSGKRALRLQVARAALAAAKMQRRDAERNLVLQVKSAYAQVAQAQLLLQFNQDIVRSQQTTLTKFRERYQRGQINEADLQRIEVQKLEADQTLAAAASNLRQARVALAFLLGVRGLVPEFQVDPQVLDYRVPEALRQPAEVALLRLAFDHRPDLIGQGYQLQSAEAALRLVRRQRFPDITLSANYSFGGFGGRSTNGPVGMQVLSFGLSLPLPVFYALQGEQRQAEAQLDTTVLQRGKATAQVVSDVATALATFQAARQVVERMEGARRDGGGILQSARGAFELTAIQYERGAASLTDYLDALRTYISTKTEYFGDLASYWTAVYQLEAAVNAELS